MDKLDKIISAIPDDVPVRLLEPIKEAMQTYSDEQTKERDELLESMGQTNKALCNKLELYIKKYGEVL